MSWVLLLMLAGWAYSTPRANHSIQENITVLGDTYSFGIFEIDLQDTNLSYYTTAGYCKNWTGTCTPTRLFKGVPCPCDYTNTSFDFCSPSYNPATHPCGCPPIEPESCASPRKLNIAPGQSLVWENNGIAPVIRFFTYNPECNAYVLRTFSDSYEPSQLTYGVLSEVTATATTTTNSRALLICPGSEFWGVTVSVSGLQTFVGGTTTNTLSTIELPTPRTPTPCSAPTQLQDTHSCIQSGVEYQFTELTAPSLFRFVVPVDNVCGTLMWTTTASFAKLSFTDPWTWPSNKSGIQTRQTWTEDRPGLFGYCLNTAPVFGTQHYIYGWIEASPTDTIFFDTANEYVQTLPLSGASALDYAQVLQAAVTVNCGNKSFTQWKGSSGDVSSIDDGFANLRFIWPQQDPQPFFPAPPFATSWQWNGYVSSTLDPTPRPGYLAISLFLNQRLAPVEPLTPSYLNYEFLTANEFNTCTLSFNGLLISPNGPIFDTIVEFGEPDLSCNITEFQNILGDVDALLLASSASSQSTQVQSQIGYEGDLISASRGFYTCQQVFSLMAQNSFAVSFTLIDAPTSVCVANFGTEEFTEDPCCTTPIGTADYMTNCMTTNKTIPQVFLTQNSNTLSQIGAFTTLPQCVAQTLQELNDLNNRALNPTIACTNTDKTSFDKERNAAWYTCFYEYFGSANAPFQGTPCQHDLECPDTGLCVADSKTCALNQTKQSLLFLECFVNEFRALDPYVLLNTCNELQVNCTQTRNVTDIALDLFTSLAITPECNIEYWFNYESTYNTINPATIWLASPGCAASGSACTLRTDWSFSTDEVNMAWDCLFPNTALCTIININLVLSTNDSCNIGACNGYSMSTHLPVLFGLLCLDSENLTFCGICDDVDGSCLMLPQFQPNPTCPGQLCILPNNTVIEADQATCLSTMGCTVAGSSDEATCLSTGTCGDATHPIYAIFSPPYDAYTGVCVVQITFQSYFGLGRSVCNAPYRTTIFGCVSYTVDEATCLDPSYAWGLDPMFYKAVGVRWITRATTEAECNAYGTKCIRTPRATIVPSMASDITIPAPLDCNPANIRNVYDWTPGKWYPGQPRNASVTPIPTSFGRKTTPVVPGDPPIFSARKLFLIMQNQSQAHFALILQSESFCRFGQRQSGLHDLACVMDPDQTEPCYQPTTGFTPTQLGVVCSQDTTPVTAYPVTITPTEQSLTTGICEILEFSTASIVAFQDNSALQLSTVLLSPTENAEWAARNGRDAIFAQVVTDGISVKAPSPLYKVTLCIPWSTQNALFRQQLDVYPVMDVAISQTIGSRVLTPLSKNVTFDNATFCASEIDLDVSGNITYYFVIRVAGTPEEVDNMARSTWTSNELGYISVILALYCIGLIVTTLGFIQTIFYKRHTFLETHLILFFLTVFFVFRIVLFAMATQHPYLLSAAVVGYLLVEFPLIVFFGFVSLFIITWSIVIRASVALAEVSSDVWIRLCRILAVLFITIVFGLFILLIILYNTILAAPTFICRGTILLYDSYTAFAMVMAYRAIFSTFAFILGICLAIVGFGIIKMMFDPDLKVPLPTQIKVILATLGGTFGLFAQAIYYLVITATTGQQSTFLSLSILLVDEVIPALLFLSCVVTLPEPKGLLSLGKSKKGSSTGGAPASGKSSSKSKPDSSNKDSSNN